MDAYVTNWNGSNPWEDNNSSSLAWTEEDEIASKNMKNGGNENEKNADMPPIPMPTSLAAVTGMAKAKKNLTTKVKRRAGQPKMDTNKAMSVMNFSSTREFMDRSSGMDPKKELDKKHFDNMMKIVKRKREESKADDGKQDYAKQFRKKKLTAEDEVRVLHEAYQFLLRKFNLGSTGGEDEVQTDRYGAPISEYPTLAALEKKDSGQDKMEQDEPDNDNVFEEATKSEDEDFEREMQLAPKPQNLRRVKSFRNFKKK